MTKNLARGQVLCNEQYTCIIRLGCHTFGSESEKIADHWPSIYNFYEIYQHQL